MNIAVIADSHNLLRLDVLHWLDGIDEILHAGDLCRPDVLARLRQIAPTVAVRGNNDDLAWAWELPVATTLLREGVAIHMCHDRAATTPPLAAVLIINGHSHRPAQQVCAGQTWLNPGAIGPRRFKLPIAAARLSIHDGQFVIREQRFNP